MQWLATWIFCIWNNINCMPEIIEKLFTDFKNFQKKQNKQFHASNYLKFPKNSVMPPVLKTFKFWWHPSFLLKKVFLKNISKFVCPGRKVSLDVGIYDRNSWPLETLQHIRIGDLVCKVTQTEMAVLVVMEIKTGHDKKEGTWQEGQNGPNGPHVLPLLPQNSLSHCIWRTSIIIKKIKYKAEINWSYV